MTDTSAPQEQMTQSKYVLVPVEPTEEMYQAASTALHGHRAEIMEAELCQPLRAAQRIKMRLRWKAMVAAAPQHKG